MRFYKIINNGYIIAIGTGLDGTEITESEYNAIRDCIINRPTETETKKYRLKENLTWEEYEIEPPIPSEDIDAEEALDILLGGAV